MSKKPFVIKKFVISKESWIYIKNVFIKIYNKFIQKWIYPKNVEYICNI